MQKVATDFIKDLTIYTSPGIQNKEIADLVDKINIQFQEIISSNKVKNANNLIEQNINQILSDIDKIFRIFFKDKNNEKEFVFFLEELNLKIKHEINILKKFYSSKDLIKKSSKIKFENKFFFGNLSFGVLDEINKIVDSYKIFLNNQVSKGYISRNELTISEGKRIRKIIKILNKEFSMNGVLDLVSNYMKKDYCVIGCAIEMSVPGSKWWENNVNDSSPDLWYTHVDQSFITPKSIIYLSDVSMFNGPTSFFPGVLEEMNINFLQNIIGRCVGKVGNKKKSKLFNYYKDSYEKKFNSKRLISHFNKLPDYLKFEAHIGWYIKKNSFFEKYLKNKEVKFVGKKGAFVIFDGAQIFHRGGLIEKDSRTVLQVTFGEKISFIKKIYYKLKRNFS